MWKVPTFTGASETRSDQSVSVGTARPWECTTSMPRRARATRAFWPGPTLTRAIDRLLTMGIETAMRTVR